MTPDTTAARRRAMARYRVLMAGNCICGGRLVKIAPTELHPNLKPECRAFRCDACGEPYYWRVNDAPGEDGGRS